MQLDLIITQLRERCESFERRVAAAAEFKPIADGAALPVPAAYVIPLDDAAETNKSANGYQQKLTDSFAVILVVSNSTDARGQAAYSTVHTLRAEIWKALLGWQPADDYDAIEYGGGNLLAMDRAYLYYQLEFSASMEIDASDTWLSVRNDELSFIEGADISTDPIDPRDPNVTPPVDGGPDGVINFTTVIDLPAE